MTTPPLDQIQGLPEPLAVLMSGWAQSPSSHPQLGDWRRVGYGRGAGVPDIDAPVVAVSAKGITPGDRDVSVDMQAALDELGAAGGGVLQLEPGRYVFDNPLFIHDSNVVLRGAGKTETTLYFRRPLTEAISPGTFWSWTGGQIFFISRQRLEASQINGWTEDEGWLAGRPRATVRPAPRGTDILLVDDTSHLVAGTMMLLQVQDRTGTNHRMLREIAGDVEGAETFPWDDTWLTAAEWQWPVVVTEVLSARTLCIEQPLKITIHAETTARLRDLGPTVRDSGVEGLTIENQLLLQTPHNENPGSNGVCFQAVHDCWATDIHVLNADVAFAMTAAKSCTLTDISAGGRSLHHFTITRANSHDNLIQDFELDEFTTPQVDGAYLHGISTEQLSSGNVWRRGNMHTGTFDSHRGLPFENLRTDIVLVNKDAVPGGNFSAGPQFGARWAHWAVTVTNDNNLGMDIADVAPRSLTAGITGLSQTGSQLTRVPSNSHFDGEIESERLEFGTDLGVNSDLLELQRALRPLS